MLTVFVSDGGDYHYVLRRRDKNVVTYKHATFEGPFETLTEAIFAAIVHAYEDPTLNPYFIPDNGKTVKTFFNEQRDLR